MRGKVDAKKDSLGNAFFRKTPRAGPPTIHILTIQEKYARDRKPVLRPVFYGFKIFCQFRKTCFWRVAGGGRVLVGSVGLG